MQDEPEISHSVREQEKDQRILQACEKVTGGGESHRDKPEWPPAGQKWYNLSIKNDFSR